MRKRHAALKPSAQALPLGAVSGRDPRHRSAPPAKHSTACVSLAATHSDAPVHAPARHCEDCIARAVSALQVTGRPGRRIRRLTAFRSKGACVGSQLQDGWSWTFGPSTRRSDDPPLRGRRQARRAWAARISCSSSRTMSPAESAIRSTFAERPAGCSSSPTASALTARGWRSSRQADPSCGLPRAWAGAPRVVKRTAEVSARRSAAPDVERRMPTSAAAMSSTRSSPTITHARRDAQHLGNLQEVRRHAAWSRACSRTRSRRARRSPTSAQRMRSSIAERGKIGLVAIATFEPELQSRARRRLRAPGRRPDRPLQ